MACMAIQWLFLFSKHVWEKNSRSFSISSITNKALLTNNELGSVILVLCYKEYLFEKTRTFENIWKHEECS